PFAFGAAMYSWLHEPENALWSVAILAMGALGTALYFPGSTGVWVSLVTALTMSGLIRVDRQIESSGVARPLFALGRISYSLYLPHVPISGWIVIVLARIGAPVWLCASAAAGVSVLWAALFFLLVERRFTTRRRYEQEPVALRPSDDGSIAAIRRNRCA